MDSDIQRALSDLARTDNVLQNEINDLRRRMGSPNLDGGRAATLYLASQKIDGGDVNGA